MMQLQFRRKTRDLLDILPFGIIVTDQQLRLRHINHWLSRRRGLEETDWKHKPLLQVFPEIRLRGLDALYRMALEGQSQITVAHRLHRYLVYLPSATEQNQSIPQRATIYPLVDNGVINGTLTVIEDVSGREETEQSLRRELHKLRILRQLDQAFATYDVQQRYNIIVESVQSMFPQSIVTLLLCNGSELEILATTATGVTPIIHPEAAPAFRQTGVTLRQPQQPGLVVFGGMGQEMIATLWWRESCLGFLSVCGCNGRTFTQEELFEMKILAERAALAIHMGQLHHEIISNRLYYQTVIDQAGDFIFTVDRSLRLTMTNAIWNHLALQNGQSWFFNLTPGHSILQAMNQELQQKWQPLCEDVLKGKIPEHQEDIQFRQGEEERWVSLRVYPLKDAEATITGLVFSGRDVTQRMQAIRQLQNVNQQLEVLVTAGSLLTTQLTSQSLAEEAAHFFAHVFDARCVLLFDLDKQILLHAHTAHPAIQERLGGLGNALAQALARNGNAGILTNLPENGAGIPSLQELSSLEQLESMMYIIVSGKRGFYGMINVFVGAERPPFTPQELEMLHALSNQLALALDNVRLYEQQQYLAITDGLTGLYNRRHFDELLETEFLRSVRYAHPLSLIMLDMDDFKLYNDTAGHLFGDKILKEIAVCLRSALRRVDIPARFGGDEFAVLLPETGLEGAGCVSERIRRCTAKILSALPDAPPGLPQVTLSLGAASAPLHASSPAELVRAADSALYQAKRTGKDRLVIYRRENDDDAHPCG